MGWFSSDKTESPQMEPSKDGGYIAPDRTARAQCWEGRDNFFKCLDQHGIIDSVKEDEKARKLCAPELKEFEKVCQGSWPAAPATEVQRLAQQFQVRHGDPGARYPDYTSSYSLFKGQWVDDDLGGRAAARAAYQAAIEGSRRATDPKFNTHDLNNDSFANADLAALGNAPTATAEDGGRTATGRRRGRGGWKKLLKDTEHENLGAGNKQPRRGRGRGGQRGGRGGRGGRRKKPADPGPEFRTYMAKANRAKLDGNIDAALDFARQAVGANPEVYQAHVLLSEIFKDRGDLELSVHTLWVGAQSARTPEAWSMTSDRILELGGEDRTWARLKSAVDCLSEALKLHTPLKYDKNLEHEVRAKKFELHKELNDSRGARMDCKNILKHWPKKTYYLHEYARLCAAWGDESELAKAKEAYDHAFNLYRDEEQFGEVGVDPLDQWSHLNIYLEVVHDLNVPWEGIATAKRLARWFLGRKAETFWDRFKDDDREFDENNERRNFVGEFQMGRASRDMDRYGTGMPIEIKVRLGLLRIKCGMHCYEEGLRHFRSLLSYRDWIKDYYEPFQQVAACLRKAGFMKEAAEYYDCLRKIGDEDDDRDELLDDNTWITIATCYQALERTEDAIAVYELVRLRKGNGYTKVCAKLAKLYEDKGETDKARFLCNELIFLNRRDLLTDAGVQMVPPSAKVLPPPIKIVRPDMSKVFPLLRPKPVVPLRELRPNGVPNVLPGGKGTFSDFNLGGPVSAPVTLLPAPADVPEPTPPPPETSKKRKHGGRRKKSILQTIVGDVEDPEAAQVDEPLIKRPKLMKPIKPKVPSRKELRSQEIQDAETRVLAYYDTVKMHWDALKDDKDEETIEQWVEAANNMLDDFTSMRVFFPERDKAIKLKGGTDPGQPFTKESRRSTASAPDAFLSIPFTEWHHVFVDLAIIYANSGEQDRCYRIVKDVLFGANVFFQDDNIQWTSYAVGLYCGFTFNDSEYLIGLARQIVVKNNFRGGMAFQLLAAVNRFAFGNNWFSAGPTQKFMLRMVKQFDFMVMPQEVRDKHDWSIHKNALTDRLKKLAHEKPELDAGILLMYGHMVAVANHSHSALPYYYRALALQPENICVNLSIAVMWIQNSMKRQTENRQFGITQGLTFLYRYYDLRVASGKVCHLQEAEYNVARTWHQLGLTHLALPAYERVLGLSEEVNKERLDSMENGEETGEVDGEDYATEAAYAVQNIYAVAGNMEAARRVTEQWLVI
ncbi:hypothetical protein M409DRAFT_66790 [Zasmidium cellare ATCC 36951]|uniref:TPR-like protein n=1 Tax=Zasmidium cellare ATCC 36951 TaxID=1080233 RepID=A0A6A6CGM9_ZASCE|nr:uncharacterized protein M409DRAFT_66790 [Zasmidium cellare ATCC 36951]KAF2166344.1 hypothetical protein M409DRAFT_66790 [Zasmidium cellare ATCC 36951]